MQKNILLFSRPRFTGLTRYLYMQQLLDKSVHDEYLEMLWILSLPSFNIDYKKIMLQCLFLCFKGASVIYDGFFSSFLFINLSYKKYGCLYCMSINTDLISSQYWSFYLLSRRCQTCYRRNTRRNEILSVHYNTDNKSIAMQHYHIDE